MPSIRYKPSPFNTLTPFDFGILSLANNNNDISNLNTEQLIERIEFYSAVTESGFVRDIEKAHSLLEKYRHMLGTTHHSELIIKLIENCYQSPNGYVHHSNQAKDLIIYYKAELGNKQKELLTALIKACNSLYKGTVRNVVNARDLLRDEPVKIILGDEYIILAHELIDNCCVSFNGRVYNVHEAKQLIKIFDTQLGKRKKLVILKLIENCSVVYEGKIHNVSDAQELLEYYETFLGDECITTIEHLITACSSLDRNGRICNIHKAKELLENYHAKLGENYAALLIELIENCSSLSPDGIVINSSSAKYLLVHFKSQLELSAHKNLVINLITNCSLFNKQGALHNIETTKSMLKEFKHALGSDYKPAIMTFIRNCTRSTSIGITTIKSTLEYFKDDLGNSFITQIIQLIEAYSVVNNSNGCIDNMDDAIDLLLSYKDVLGDDFIDLFSVLFENCLFIYNGHARNARQAEHLLNFFKEALGDRYPVWQKQLIETSSMVVNKSYLSNLRTDGFTHSRL